jgi:hypothetical protein
VCAPMRAPDGSFGARRPTLYSKDEIHPRSTPWGDLCGCRDCPGLGLGLNNCQNLSRQVAGFLSRYGTLVPTRVPLTPGPHDPFRNI